MNKILMILIAILGCSKNINNMKFINKDLNSDLILAVINNDIKQVSNLIERGANVNYKNDKGNTALIVASNNGNLEIVKYLVEKEANINYKNTNRNTALMGASYSGNIEIVKLLIEKGANINDEDIYGETGLAFASESGHIEIVKLLLEKGANINDRTREGYTALIIAVLNGHIEIVKFLIEKGANVNDKNYFRYTALMQAFKSGHKEIAKLLIEQGASVDFNTIDSEILTETLANCIINNDMEKTFMLMHCNNVNYGYNDNYGNTLLHHAALTHNHNLLNILLLKGCDINALNDLGASPLYYALAKESIDPTYIWNMIDKDAVLIPNCYVVNDKSLVDLLSNYEDLCDKLVYKPLISKILGNVKIVKEYNEEIIRKIIKILKLKEDDFINEKRMISFIRSTLSDISSLQINLSDIDIRDDNNEDVELNIEVFDEIFKYFTLEDYWNSIKEKGINKVINNFKDKLNILKDYKPINKSLLVMTNDERLKYTNFQRKKKLAHLLRLISKTAINGYNNDKIKFVVNQILDVVACNEGSLEAINDAVRYLSGEEDNILKEIISDELMQLRYNLLKEVCKDKIKISINNNIEYTELTPHIFPQLIKDMHNDLKIKVEYLDDMDYHLIYDKQNIIEEVKRLYKERMIEYIRDKIEENGSLWNKVRDYIERDIFRGRAIIQVENFLYSSDDYKIKKEVVRALFINFKFINNMKFQAKRFMTTKIN